MERCQYSGLGGEAEALATSDIIQPNAAETFAISSISSASELQWQIKVKSLASFLISVICETLYGVLLLNMLLKGSEQHRPSGSSLTCLKIVIQTENLYNSFWGSFSTVTSLGS